MTVYSGDDGYFVADEDPGELIPIEVIDLDDLPF